jgi:hypothetical protein
MRPPTFPSVTTSSSAFHFRIQLKALENVHPKAAPPAAAPRSPKVINNIAVPVAPSSAAVPIPPPAIEPIPPPAIPPIVPPLIQPSRSPARRAADI